MKKTLSYCDRYKRPTENIIIPLITEEQNHRDNSLS